MLSFKEMLEMKMITEELHSQIKSVMNEPEADSRNPYSKFNDNKFNRISKIARQLTEKGEDTGLVDGKPKKGSSRAWFEQNEPKKLIVDNTPVQHNTGIKIAIHGTLDKHTAEPKLLGEMQNEAEHDHYIQQSYGMLRHHGGNKYSTNHYGILAPVFDHHEDSHWLEMSKTEPLTKSKFKSLTKTETHPKGLEFDDFTRALQNEHQAAHGMHSGKDDLDHVRSHPLYEKTQDFINDSGHHPGDLRLQNMGVWKHPVTGEEHPVIRDYGFSNDIAKVYSKARRSKYK